MRHRPEPDERRADAATYLRHLGLDPDATGTDREALGRLQRAHLRAVPFETLAVAGHPHGDADGEGVVLDVEHLYRKVVDRGRGGYCFELNGLFGWLLDEWGFDARRVAGMVLSDTGSPTPANHHAVVVDLDRPLLVDVGTGSPAPRRPIPLDGTAVVDALDTAWRVVPADRPDSEYRLEYRPAGPASPAAVDAPGGDDDGVGAGDDDGVGVGGDDGVGAVGNDDGDGADRWTTRYVFDDVARELSYFRASCEFLATAPESVFTGDPVVLDRTDRGYRKLTADSLVRVADGERTERSVDPGEWERLLVEAFDLPVPGGAG